MGIVRIEADGFPVILKRTIVHHHAVIGRAPIEIALRAGTKADSLTEIGNGASIILHEEMRSAALVEIGRCGAQAYAFIEIGNGAGKLVLVPVGIATQEI